MTKHIVTDSRGQTHKRVSLNRVYSHAVVAHYAADPLTIAYPQKASTDVAWASRLDLAEKEAARRRRLHPRLESIEIIEAVQS